VTYLLTYLLNHNYLRQGTYVTPGVYLFICLLLCWQDYTKNVTGEFG